MASEWLKIMLEEIERKRLERAADRDEEQRRRAAAADPAKPAPRPRARTAKGRATR
jgi:hypothetical protein